MEGGSAVASPPQSPSETDSKLDKKARKERRKQKRSLILKHHRNHWKHMIRSTVPLFVAGTISKAVSQLLEFIVGSGDIGVQILVEFLYTVLFAHTAGYLVALYIPDSNPLFEYFHALATDNASFAWSSSFTLLTLKYLYTMDTPWIALGVWCGFLLFVCIIIYLVNYVQERYLKLSSTELRTKLRDFESESFALAVAYSFTVIVAACIYHNESTDYLANTDDINSTNDDYSAKNDLNWLFFMYICILSIGLFSYQRYIDNRIRKRKMKRVSKALLESEFGESISSGINKGVEEIDHIDDQFSYLRDIRNYMLFWDEDRQAREAFKCFYYTAIGYFVACGWYIWAILTFQNLFHFTHGQSFGLFLYAIIATISVILILTIVSVKEELSGLKIDVKQIGESSAIQHNALELKGILYFSFSRLTIGLAWQQLLMTLVGSVIPERQSDRQGLVVMMKLLTALVVFILGCMIELWIKSRKKQRPRFGPNPKELEMDYSVLQNVLDEDENYDEPLL